MELFGVKVLMAERFGHHKKCDKTFLGNSNTHTYSPQTGWMGTDQSRDTAKVQLCEPVSFIWVTYSRVSEGLPTEADMTQRQLNHQSPPQHGDSSQSWETWSTPHSLQAAQWVGECPV